MKDFDIGLTDIGRQGCSNKKLNLCGHCDLCENITGHWIIGYQTSEFFYKSKEQRVRMKDFDIGLTDIGRQSYSDKKLNLCGHCDPLREY